MKKEIWSLRNKKADFDALQKESGLDALTLRILANREIDTSEKLEQFLHGDLRSLPSPHLLKDAEKAALLLKTALERGDAIAVASDYDADGIFSGQLLYEALSGLGGKVSVFTPDRISEGYGLNTRIVDDAKSEGAAVLITCDNGISASEPVAYAKSLGFTVIVTDHHEVPYTETAKGRSYILPPADAVVDPQQEDCPYPTAGICGAVVAYKLMQLLYELMGRPAEETDRLVLYAGFATVTDIMSLNGENRVLVKEALRQLQHTDRPGLRALIRVTQLEKKTINAHDLGFILGPCFNASGRLDTVKLAQELLRASSDEEALPLAERLKSLNDLRRSYTLDGVKNAHEMLEKTAASEKILVLHLPECHESVAGIVAGRLKDDTQHPVLVITGHGDQCKGSARSIETYNMFEGLSACSELLNRFGGHPMAAGFSLPEENIPVLREKMNAQAKLDEEDFCVRVRLDAAMPPAYATEERIREWESLAPFGRDMEPPLFGRSRLRVSEIRVMGEKRNAVRMRFYDEDGSGPFEGIWFGDAAVFEAFIAENYGPKAFTALERRQKSVPMALAYQPKMHEYNGHRSIQFLITNFQAVQS